MYYNDDESRSPAADYVNGATSEEERTARTVEVQAFNERCLKALSERIAARRSKLGSDPDNLEELTRLSLLRNRIAIGGSSLLDFLSRDDNA